MLNVIIDMRPHSRRAESFLADTQLWRLLAENAYSAVQRTFPRSETAVVFNDPKIRFRVGAAFKNACFVCGPEEAPAGPDVQLRIAPLKGAVSLARLEGVAAILKDGHANVESLTAIPANANPVWLSEITARSGGIVTVPKQSELPRFLSEGDLGPLTLGDRKVKGSQFLPRLFLRDGVISSSIPGTEPGDAFYVPYSVDEDETVPMFYRLPVFQMGEDVVPQWPEKNDFSVLFRESQEVSDSLERCELNDGLALNTAV